MQGSPARLVHAIGALNEAGRLFGVSAWCEAAQQGLAYCLSKVVRASGKTTLYVDGQRPNAMADCQLLAAASLCEFGDVGNGNARSHCCARR